MSRKHAELEREFIEELANRTGSTLSEWMAAIDGTGIADRNAIIDWLRPQGLTFAHASWLERIHHNGGRPIYVGTTAPPVQPPLPVEQPTAAPKALTPKPLPRPVATAPTLPAAAPVTRPPSPAPSTYSLSANSPAANSPSTGDPISALLARGKGLKPLADMVLREIARAVPGSTIAATGDLLEFANPAAYACLHIGPKELRLGLALPGMNPPPPVQAPRIAGSSLGLTHMLVLSDARQVDSDMIQLIVLANSKANPT